MNNIILVKVFKCNKDLIKEPPRLALTIYLLLREHIQKLNTINILHHLVLFIGQFIVVELYYFYDVRVVQIFKDIEFRFGCILKFFIVKPCDFNSIGLGSS